MWGQNYMSPLMGYPVEEVTRWASSCKRLAGRRPSISREGIRVDSALGSTLFLWYIFSMFPVVKLRVADIAMMTIHSGQLASLKHM